MFVEVMKAMLTQQASQVYKEEVSFQHVSFLVEH